MPANYGYTFAPGADGNRPEDQAQGGGRPSGLSPQAAVKLLQLRVPERPAAGGIAPQALLQGQGGAGFPGGGGLQAIIQMLMGLSGGGGQAALGAMGGGGLPAGGGGGQVPTSGGGGAVPTPRVIPGIDIPGRGGPLHDMGSIDFDMGGGQTLRNILGGSRLGDPRQGQMPLQGPPPPLF